jgi:hypothetical protein
MQGFASWRQQRHSFPQWPGIKIWLVQSKYTRICLQCSLLFGSYSIVQIDPDAVAALDSDGATAIDSARAEAVSLDVKAAADSDGVPAPDSDRAAVPGLDGRR